jgi:hypothetical protein
VSGWTLTPSSSVLYLLTNGPDLLQHLYDPNIMIRRPAIFLAGLLLALALQRGAQAANPCSTLPPATAPGFQTILQAFLDNACYQSWTHDPAIRTTDGVHPNVQVYYSPSLWSWLTTGKRIGEPPEGGLLVKAQFGDTSNPTKLTDWAIMVKDRDGAWDGWYWADLVPTSSLTSPPPQAQGRHQCQEAQFPAGGFGQYCLNCHSSAANGDETFATTRFVDGSLTLLKMSAVLSSVFPDDNMHHQLAQTRMLGSATSHDSACMVPEPNDHVVVPGKPIGPQKFVTSDQCTGCHNATATLAPSRPDLPSMLYYLQSSPPKTVNLSINGEWRVSMMGLAGRDPIFFSQLNSEVTLHDNLKDHPGDAKEFVQDLCLHCHGVMGQRQYHDDTGKYFTRNVLRDPDSTYGALARDGVSCTVCHRISPEGLGTPSTYTGNFNLGPPDQMNGPYKNVIDLPMKNTLGMKPQEGDQIKGSDLCGTCHTIVLPVYRANGFPVMENGKQKTFVEQATFFEWLNSDFADNGPTPQSCQDCHMPRSFTHDGVSSPLAYKIANIEDNTFPAVDYRAPDPEITLTTRDDYHRHTLLGINVFALEMFKQFRTELGLYANDPMLRTSLNTINALDTAIDTSSNEIAKTNTADVKILSVQRTNQTLQIDVKVTNKAGHSFPSGVGFRRAFLDLQVLFGDEVVWESGATSPKGVIVDGSGQPLITEAFTRQQQQFQPHYWTQNPITSQDQVQIYEELVVNPEGLLTTSFIALDQKVKDNRLQPRGWSSTGPEAAETGPVGTCLPGSGSPCDPSYQDGGGSSIVRYVIPRSACRNGGNCYNPTARVQATLYYQTIPHYYQQQRATDAAGVDTERLIRFARQLKVSGTPVDRWVLPIASDETAVPQ